MLLRQPLILKRITRNSSGSVNRLTYQYAQPRARTQDADRWSPSPHNPNLTPNSWMEPAFGSNAPLRAKISVSLYSSFSSSSRFSGQPDTYAQRTGSCVPASGMRSVNGLEWKSHCVHVMALVLERSLLQQRQQRRPPHP